MSGLTDRELLEGAAMAAGFQLEYLCDMPHMIVEEWSGDPSQHPEQVAIEWSPLTNDGDALRLAVACRLSVTVDDDVVGAWLQDGSHHCDIPASQDIQADVRRAIVRAAYEIGSAKP